MNWKWPWKRQRASEPAAAPTVTWPDAAAFAQIPLHSHNQSAGSPDVAPAFRGIAIATPEVVDLGSPWHDHIGINGPRPVLPVCGTARYTGAFEARFRVLADQIFLVAIDARTHVPCADDLRRKGGEDAMPDLQHQTPEWLAQWGNQASTSYFNANAYYTLDLPVRPATYHLFAAIGELVSNVRTVRIVGREDEPARGARALGEALFGAAATAPAMPADFRGVRIQPRLPRWPTDGGPLWLDGIVHLDARDAAALGATPIQRALVVTAWSDDCLLRSWNAAGERAVFADDQQSVDGVIRGAFSVQLPSALAGSQTGLYVLVSAGPTLSNLVFVPAA